MAKSSWNYTDLPQDRDVKMVPNFHRYYPPHWLPYLLLYCQWISVIVRCTQVSKRQHHDLRDLLYDLVLRHSLQDLEKARYLAPFHTVPTLTHPPSVILIYTTHDASRHDVYCTLVQVCKLTSPGGLLRPNLWQSKP